MSNYNMKNVFKKSTFSFTYHIIDMEIKIFQNALSKKEEHSTT